MAKKKDDVGKMSFEDAIKTLTEIVGKIEQGEIPLQDSLEQYEKGMSLIKHCRGILQKAERRIEKIAAESEGEQEVEEGEPGDEQVESGDEGLF